MINLTRGTSLIGVKFGPIHVTQDMDFVTQSSIIKEVKECESMPLENEIEQLGFCRLVPLMDL